MNKYLNNIYVIAGLVGLGFYFYKRRQILAEQPEAEKSIDELEDKEAIEETKDPFDGVPENLKRDVGKMDTRTLKRTIITNQKMLKRARMSDSQKSDIKKALNYLKQEYKLRK